MFRGAGGYAFGSVAGFAWAACVGTFMVSDTNLTWRALYIYTASIHAILACSALVYTNAVVVANLAVVAYFFTQATHAVLARIAASSTATSLLVCAAAVHLTVCIETALESLVAQILAFAILAFLTLAARGFAPGILARLARRTIAHTFAVGATFTTAARNPCTGIVASCVLPISFQGVAFGLGVVSMLFWARRIHGFEFQRITVDVLKTDEGRLCTWICRRISTAAYRTHAVFVIRKPVRADTVVSTTAWLYESLASERTAPLTGTHVILAGVRVA